MTETKRTFAKGQAFLALIFLIGTIVVLVGATLAFLTGAFVDTSYGYRASVQADAVADSGAEDAVLQLERDSGFSPGTYSVATGSSTATVTVSRNTPSTNFVTVLSSASVSNSTRKISVVLSLDPTTEQATVVSWQESQ